MTNSRREVLKFGAIGVAALAAGVKATAARAEAGVLTIAYNVNLPSWDPTTGPSAVNPTIQGEFGIMMNSQHA